MAHDMDVRLFSKDGNLIGYGDLIPGHIIESKIPLRFRNRSYYYQRHGFDNTVHYREMPEPLNVDDLVEEII